MVHLGKAICLFFKNKFRMPPKKGGVHTLWSTSGAGEASDDDDKRQHFSGGHSSGINVEDPRANHPASSILAAARANPMAGSPAVPEENTGFHAFSGGGASMATSAVIQSANAPRPAAKAAPRDIEVIVTIRLWKDGFQYAFGSEPLDPEPPLLSLESSEFAQMKAAVAASRVPAFIVNAWQNSPAAAAAPGAEPVFELRIADSTGKDYEPPRAPGGRKGPSPFGGAGRVMSDDVPTTTTSDRSGAPAGAAPAAPTGGDVANIKVRFVDGSTKTIAACPSWTVDQLAAYVSTHTTQSVRWCRVRTAHCVGVR